MRVYLELSLLAIQYYVKDYAIIKDETRTSAGIDI